LLESIDSDLASAASEPAVENGAE